MFGKTLSVSFTENLIALSPAACATDAAHFNIPSRDRSDVDAKTVLVPRKAKNDEYVKVLSLNPKYFDMITINKILNKLSIHLKEYNVNENLTEIIIPESILTIESKSFYNCQNLEQIKVHENNTNYKSIDGILFGKLEMRLFQYPIGRKEENYSIPITVLSIEPYSFSHCQYLKRIEMIFLVEIKIEAFSYNSNLEIVE